MRRRHPEVNLGIRRAPERRMRAWQVLAGADEEIFRQEHEPQPPRPPRLPDFTDTGELGISTAGIKKTEKAED
jgi:hypothetical protein